VTDGAGNRETASATLTDGLEITIAARIDSVTCYGGNNGKITLVVSGDTGSYDFKWSGPGGTTPTGQNPSGLPAGKYSVVVTGTSGCTAGSTYEVLQPEELKVSIDRTVPADCAGKSSGAIFSAGPSGGTMPYSYQWNTGETNRNLTGIPAGDYSLTVRDRNLCEAFVSATVPDGPHPAKPEFDPVSPVCQGGTPPILPSISKNNITGRWEPFPVSNVTSGTYIFTPDTGQCADTTSLQVTVTPKTTPTFDFATSYCRGSKGITLPPISMELIPGTWDSDTISTLFSASYRFTPAAGACAEPVWKNITVAQPPPIPQLSVVQPNCTHPEGAITIISPVGTGLQYSIDGVNYSSDPFFTGLQPRNYTVRVSNTGGCISRKDTVIHAVPGSPDIPVLSVIQPNCRDTAGSIMVVNAIPGLSYSVDGITWANTTGRFTDLPPGTYHVSSKNSSGCISPVVERTLVKPGKPNLSVDVKNVSAPGISDGVIAWSIAGGTEPFITSLQYPDGKTVDFTASGNATGLTTGYYTLTITDRNFCSDDTILFVSGPSYFVMPAPEIIECPGQVPGPWSSFMAFERSGGTVNASCKPDTSTFHQVGTDIISGTGPCRTITRSYAITACRETITGIHTIEIRDHTPPRIDCPVVAPVPDNAIPPPYHDYLEFSAKGGILDDDCGIDYSSWRVFRTDTIKGTGGNITSLQRTYGISDLCGNYNICNQEILVYPFTASGLTCPPPVSVSCPDEIPQPFISFDEFRSGGGAFTGSCAADAGSFTMETPATGGNCPETILRRYSVTDQCGISSGCTHVINVHDTVPPRFAAIPADTAVNCINNVPPAVELQWSDNCGQSGMAVPVDISSGDFCQSIIRRKWTATDRCNNRDSVIQEITILDKEPPLFSCPAGLAFCEQPGKLYTIPEIQDATDNCKGPVTIRYQITGATNRSGTGDASGIFNSGVSVITWTAVDGCGNDSTCTTTITIDNLIKPTFHIPDSVCAGAVIEPFPGLSNEGVRGTWSALPDNTATRKYTFIPDDDQCASSSTVTIVIRDNVTPVFDPVGPFWEGDPIPDLPVVSVNGITGTWTPSISNTRTTEYTFTPAPGMCAVPVTMIIAINGLNPMAEPAEVCAGDSVRLYANVFNKSGTITYSWRSEPTGFSSSLENPVVIPYETTSYTVVVNDGGKPLEKKVRVVVHPLPAAPQSEGDRTICEGQAIPALKVTSGPGLETGWFTTPAGGIPVATDTVKYIPPGRGTFYAETRNRVTGCVSAERTSVSLIVNEVPSPPVSAGDVTICSDQDTLPLLTTAPADVYVDWYTAATGGTAVASGTLTFTPASPGLYYAESRNSISGCVSPVRTQIAFTVNPTPQAPVIEKVIHPTVPGGTGRVELSGLPPTGRWTILSSTGGLSISGTGTSVILEGLAANTRYAFMVVSEAGCNSPLSEKVTLNVRDELFIPEGFSPNGDGINDYFEITWLKNDPAIHARMIIFDRRGNRIFEKENYGNKEFWKNIPSDMWWNGTSGAKNMGKGNKVPEGNYYYILDLGKGKMIKGTVMVKYLKIH